MKTSKSALQTSAPEECGVWLDTVQLKGKAKQKRLARPISKLLNPFADGGGYSLAVALNFTQTKIKMPKTKQSSISAFFVPQHRVLNKMSTSEEPNIDPAPSSLASTSTAPAPVAPGTKRRREMDFEKPDSESGVAHEWKRESVTELEATVWQERSETSHTPSQKTCCESEEELYEEFNPPQCKRRCTDTSSLADDSQPPPQAWSQDPLLTYSQYSDSEFYLTNQKNTTATNSNDSEPSFPNSLQSEAFGFQMDLKGRTSTQKSFTLFHSPVMDDDKENSIIFYSKSPSKHTSFAQNKPLVNHIWTESKTTSPHKHTDKLWMKVDKDESYMSKFKWTKPSCSPLKKQPLPQQQTREVDEDSLAMLFTQDSVGFRVIAHRGPQIRSPLKDQSNINTGIMKASAYKSLVEDKEDEMLFTQDSQGNVMIKH